MRGGVNMLGIVTILALALPGRAQTQAASFFTGANPREIKSIPIDVSKAAQAYNLSNAFHTPAPTKTVGLSSFFPKFSFPTWPPKVGVNQLPQGKNPFQPNRPVGVNLFEPRK
jgi:hypothetical protein